MELDAVRKVHIVPLWEEEHEAQEEEINQLLAEGWRLITIHTEENYEDIDEDEAAAHMARAHRQILVLARLDENQQRAPALPWIWMIHVETLPARVNVYLETGWILLATEAPVVRIGEVGTSRTRYVLGRPNGVEMPAPEAFGTGVADMSMVERMVEGVQILQRYAGDVSLHVMTEPHVEFDDIRESHKARLRQLGWKGGDTSLMWIFWGGARK